MKPLIKWPGGKSTEIRHIEQMIPQFNSYYEPFFGGGALFFELEPNRSHINDISKNLMDFYKFLKKSNKRRNVFKQRLYEYVENWDRIDKYMLHFGNSFITIYKRYRKNELDDLKFDEEIQKLFEDKIIPFNGLFSANFCIDQNKLRETIQKNVVSKLKRIKNKIDIENKFSEQELMKNIETAFRSGFYLHFRSVMNQINRGRLQVSKEKELANYYFVREFCYGGMFRFNARGDFNIPYGGNAYNKKDFRKKVDNLFSDEVSTLLDIAVIGCEDFGVFLNKHRPQKNDFVFFDPPYDTEFSDYEENSFTRREQERLANIIKNLDSKFILIIKETPFIQKLYKKMKGVQITSFDKIYSYNMRGRNNRKVKHLIIHNLNFKPISAY